MCQVTRSFLELNRNEGTAAMRRLITKMKEAGVTKLLLTDHPTYNLELGIAGTDLGYDATGKDVFECEVRMIEDYRERFTEWLKSHSSDEELWIDVDVKWPWIRDCWLAAGGKESGCVVVLLNNGMENMIDLNTGEEPVPELGFDEIG